MSQFREHPSAEREVIAAMLQSEFSASVALGTLTAADFGSEIHQMIVCGVERAMQGIEPYDLKLVEEAITQCLRDSKRKVSIPPGLVSSYSQENSDRWQGYIETVRRMSTYRKVLAFVEWVQTEIEGYADLDELFPELQKRLNDLYSSKKVMENVTLGPDSVSVYDNVLEERARTFNEGQHKEFDWPWDSWNRNVRPLRPGLAGIIAAPDGMGKSSALEQIAERWAQSWQVVFVHCENDVEYTLDRRAARLSDIDIHIIESGDYSNEQRQKLQAIRYSWVNNLHYVDGSGCTCDQILSEIAGLQAQGKCDAVVIDYLNKIRPSRGQSRMFSGRNYEVVGDNMERIKSAAVKGGWPVMTAVQMTKSAQEGAQLGGRLTRDQIRGSGETSEKVQLVALLSREILDKSITSPQRQVVYEAGEYGPRAKWRIDKQNRGRTMDFEQIYVGRRFMFKDTPI